MDELNPPREVWYCPLLNCWGTTAEMREIYAIGGVECECGPLCSCRRAAERATDGD